LLSQQFVFLTPFLLLLELLFGSLFKYPLILLHFDTYMPFLRS
jgi:hypothetical protein